MTTFKENATTGNRGAEAKQNGGQADYSAMLEVLGRIAEALEKQAGALEGIDELLRYNLGRF